MSNRSLVVLGITIAALIVLVVAVSKQGLVGEESSGDPPNTASVAAFTQALQVKVMEQGNPIEGFEPSMFLAAYPGLEEEDFDGVEAEIGVYVYKDGELAHDLQGEEMVHSAAQTITDRGMATLLANVSSRLGIDASSEQGVEEVLAALEGDVQEEGDAPSATEEPTPGTTDPVSATSDDLASGESVTLEGEIVCLPHRDTSGPITLECAFGLKTDEGVHYGLKNLDQISLVGGVLNTGVRVRVAGDLEEPDASNKYAIEAVVNVASITAL